MPKERERATTLTPELKAKLFADSESRTDIASGLTYERRGQIPVRQKTGRELADEAIARTEKARAADPAWQRMHETRRERGGLAAADLAELHAKRMDEARESGNDALVLARGREFAQASSAGWAQWLVEQDEAYHAECDELGIDPSDVEDTELPSYALGTAVAQAIEYGRAQAMDLHSTAMIEGITGRNVKTYRDSLEKAGILNADDLTFEEYESLKAFIGVSMGVDVGELAVTDPATAADWMTKARGQIDEWDSRLRRDAFGQQILSAESSNVSEGIESTADRESKKLDELIDLQRQAAGLGPRSETEAPFFSPDWEPVTATTPEIETDAEIKASISADDTSSIKADSAFTVDGQPTTYAEVVRDHEAEARTAERARDVVSPPRSFG